MDDDSQLQRRIELGHHEDLAYLIANVRDAATARLNEALPPDGEDADAFRTEVEALVNDYINQTFTLAGPNISINGLDVNPKEFLRSNPKSSDNESYQPFDSQKRKQVAELIMQEEKLLEEVAALKRTKPAEAASEQAQRITATAERDDELFQKRIEEVSVLPEIQLDIPTLERQEDVETQFKTAIEALNRLKKDMPSVVAKMERAKVAGKYVLEGS